LGSNGLQLTRHLQPNNLISHEYESRERQVLSLLICYKINFTRFSMKVAVPETRYRFWSRNY
jgi:hypothetical protein